MAKTSNGADSCDAVKQTSGAAGAVGGWPVAASLPEPSRRHQGRRSQRKVVLASGVPGSYLRESMRAAWPKGVAGAARAGTRRARNRRDGPDVGSRPADDGPGDPGRTHPGARAGLHDRDDGHGQPAEKGRAPTRDGVPGMGVLTGRDPRAVQRASYGVRAGRQQQLSCDAVALRPGDGRARGRGAAGSPPVAGDQPGPIAAKRSVRTCAAKNTS